MKSKYGHRTMNWFEAIVNKLGGEEAAEKFLRGELEVVAKTVNFITATFKQVVNYDLSIKESAKSYDRVNEKLTDQNFPSTEKGEKEVELALFHFGKIMTSEEVISEMGKLGYRSATMKELLSFGNKTPELHRKFSVIALNAAARLSSVWPAGYLCSSDIGSFATLGYDGNGWLSDYRFLGVRN